MEKPKGKLLHTDKEPVNSVPTDVKVDAETFLQKNKERTEKHPVIDLSTGAPLEAAPTKKENNKGWIWLLVICIIVIIIFIMVNYFKQKKAIENGQSI